MSLSRCHLSDTRRNNVVASTSGQVDGRDCFICFVEKLCDGHKAIPVASFDEELCDGREVITVANERRVRVDPDGGVFGGRDNHDRMQGAAFCKRAGCR